MDSDRHASERWCTVRREPWGGRAPQVFGASALALADLRVLKDPTFRKVSVTAEQWVPLEQVPERALLPWLALKRAQGYRRVPCPPARSSALQAFVSCMGVQGVHGWAGLRTLLLGSRDGVPPLYLCATGLMLPLLRFCDQH